MGSKLKGLSISDSILVSTSLLFIAQTWTLVYHSVGTVGNKATQLSYADYIDLDILNTINCTTLNTIERWHSTVKKIWNQSL